MESQAMKYGCNANAIVELTSLKNQNGSKSYKKCTTKCINLLINKLVILHLKQSNNTHKLMLWLLRDVVNMTLVYKMCDL